MVDWVLFLFFKIFAVRFSRPRATESFGWWLGVFVLKKKIVDLVFHVEEKKLLTRVSCLLPKIFGIELLYFFGIGCLDFFGVAV
jgi:hypothetical protein